MPVHGAQGVITSEVSGWEGVTTAPHRFGGIEYRLDRREIGHIHGDHLVDVPLPVALRAEVIAAGQAVPHHLLPDSGWVSIYLHTSADVDHALAVLARSYAVARTQRARRADAAADPADEATRP